MGKSISKKRCVIFKGFIQDSKKIQNFSKWLHAYETSHDRNMSWLQYLTKKLKKHYFQKYGIKKTSKKELTLYFEHAKYEQSI